MAESAYHNEALRRQRAIERKKEAQRRLIAGDQSKEAMVDGDGCGKDAILYSGPGHFEQNRTNIKRFRLHEDGFNIRYRNRVNHAPHCDLAYSVIYPHKDNSTYTCDENRNNRRMNLMSEKYEVIKTINGEFPIKTVTENGSIHRIYHRRTDNNPVDKIYPIIHPKELPPKHTELPPRKPHLKV